MITTIEPGRYFHITGLSPGEIEDGITSAVQMALDHSTKEGWHGVLVTRHGPSIYTVNLSGEVPFGITMERDLARRSSDKHNPAAGLSVCC